MESRRPALRFCKALNRPVLSRPRVQSLCAQCRLFPAFHAPSCLSCLPSPMAKERKFFRMLSVSFSNAFCSLCIVNRHSIDSLTVYHNYKYDNSTKSYSGTILYKNLKIRDFPPRQERVRFLGNSRYNCTLLINPVKVNDSGQLGLRMTAKEDKWMEPIGLNISGRCFIRIKAPQLVSTSHPLRIPYPLPCCPSAPPDAPKLKIQVSPTEATVTEGESVTMTCQIVSSNPRHQGVSWLRDGAPLLGEETPMLTLPQVTRKMSGQYQCKAHNDVGSEKSEAVDLQVHYAPEPSSVQIFSSPAKEGNKVELTCISLANPHPTNYTWYYNGLEMPGKTDRTFQIPEVLLRHAGEYSCLAENSLGPGEVGQGADLEVQYPPKEVITVIQNRTPIREGDSVILSCTYNSSNPRVTRYEWNHLGFQDQLLPAGLTIRKVAWDTGPVKCAACNQWCLWSPPVNLDVQYAPKDVSVQVTPHNEIRSGNPVLLQCDFLSSRPTDVRFFWKKNGILLEEGKKLSFDAISPEDAGIYHCLVNNSIGQTSSKDWVLRVLYAPRSLRVSISPKDRLVEGKKAVLTCESDANPPTSHYTWFDWNNQDLRHYDQTLRLDPVTLQHSGAYWCQGTNRLGRGQSPPTTLTVHCKGPSLFSSGPGHSCSARRIPQAEGPHSLGCYNPVMEDAVSYAALRFPLGETDAPRPGDAGTSETRGLSPNRDDTVTYSVVQKRQVCWQRLGSGEGCPDPGEVRPRAGTSQSEAGCSQFPDKRTPAWALGPPGGAEERRDRGSGLWEAGEREATLTTTWLSQGDYENVTPEVLEDEGIHYSELVRFGFGEPPLAQEGVEYATLKH
ncbi:hypothetical protein E2I00_005439 [Balaenoptera physalus]|uniref:B-cell receptor CD22 n=1 Tax=Balaenoptera physalus TaxID=9770 RepID=A0A643CI21_BALPH|nr:hypothetical protein E2I00_005439 [Balaenoptera physalus]